MTKINDRLTIAAAAAYSYLFFEQNAGINFLVFNLLILGLLVYNNTGLLRQKSWVLSTAMCLVTATSIFFHSSALAIIGNVFGLLLVSAYSFNSRTSSVFSFLFSLYSIATSMVYLMIDLSERSASKKDKDDRERNGYKYFTLFIVLLLCVLFFVLYRESNPLFKENTKWVNLDLINFEWFMFTFFGFFIVYGLLNHHTVKQVSQWESSMPDIAPQHDEKKASQYQSETSAGLLLFAFLNCLLLVLNIGDIHTIWFKGELPQGISHSDFVHNGVELIIFSIVIAAGLIMFLYRNSFNAGKGSVYLRALVYAWILQNLIMLFSTTCRNQFYIEEYNLTHKRIGVYVWIVLAVIGLILTGIKVRNSRSNWFLIRSNVSAWFCVLALSSTLNWDVLITRYNLSNKPLADVDVLYLFSLSDSNIPELLKVTKDKDFHVIDEKLSFKARPVSYKSLLMNKIEHYLNEHKSDWQSWDLADQHIMNHLIKK